MECMYRMARSLVCQQSCVTSGVAVVAAHQKRDKAACEYKYAWIWPREGCKGHGGIWDEPLNAVARHTRRHCHRAVCITWMRAISRSPRCERTGRQAGTG